MTTVSADLELVKAYVTEGSDAAFRALVARHVDLVYATALRQVGDAGIAEEITQNVFVALARKAPRLGGVTTLAGWLHRTAILEAKARVRAELRRRRREEKAIELAAMQHEGTSALEAVVPLLDEGLLRLRENDRLALVLRFLEGRSLRDVGVALGVDEDAARKRVARALDRLSEFFREWGFTLPAAAGSTALFTTAVQAAPAGLAVAAANAGLAAGSAVTGINLLFFHLMALTKAQTAVVCVILAAAPLAWQYQAEGRVTTELAALKAQLETDRRTVEELELETQRTREAMLRAQAEAQNARTRLAALDSQVRGKTPPPVYQWDDSSPYVRLPKEFLRQLSLTSVADPRGRLTDQIKEMLQMSELEAMDVQAAMDRFVAEYNTALLQNIRPVTPTDKDLAVNKPGKDETGRPLEVRVFEVKAPRDQLGAWRQNLFQELEVTLGAKRSEVFRKGLRNWMPMGDEYGGLNSSMAVFNFDHRVRFDEPRPGSRGISWMLYKQNGEMMSLYNSTESLAPAFRQHLQDWITIADSQPVGRAASEP